MESLLRLAKFDRFFCRRRFVLVRGVGATPQSHRDSGAILNHLNDAISWYRHVASVDATAGQPSDELYLENARNSASQALQLAFQAALAQAAMAPKEGGGAANQSAGSVDQGSANQQQSMAKAAAETADRITQTQSQLENLNQQIESARGKKRESCCRNATVCRPTGPRQDDSGRATEGRQRYQ